MSSFLMTAILFSFAGSTALAWRRRLEEQLPLAVAGIVLTLYLFSLFDLFMVGAYVVLIFAGISGVLLIYRSFKANRQEIGQYLLTPGCAAFFLIALWLWYSYRGYMYIEWDDFSHWGLAVKNMSIFAALPSGVREATITYTDYPPASTLFSWLWTWLSGEFNEGDTQRALNMMMFCFLLPMMREQEWKKPGRALAMTILLFVLPLTVNPRCYRTLQVDTALGCIALYVLYSWFFCTRGKTGLLTLSLSLCMLTLVKETGLLLAAMTLLIIIAHEWLGRKDSKRPFLKVLALLTLSCGMGYGSWKGYLHVHHVQEVWSKGFFALDEMVDLLLGHGPDYRYRTIANFLESLCRADWWHTGHWVSVSHAMWIGLMAAGQCWIIDRCPDQQMKLRCRRVFIVLTAEVLVYIGLLLSLYLFQFRVDEAENLISMERYLSSWMLPYIGITLLAFERAWRQNGGSCCQNAPVYLLLGLLMAVSPLMIAQNTVLAHQQNEVSYQTRMDELLPENVRAQLDSASDRVYIVASKDNGYQYYLGAYQFTPVPVQQGMWTTWPVRNKRMTRSEISAIEYTPQEWAEVLLNGAFTYVYLDTIDNRFIRDYQPLFENPRNIRSGKLYRIQQMDDILKLIEVQ